GGCAALLSRRSRGRELTPDPDVVLAWRRGEPPFQSFPPRRSSDLQIAPARTVQHLVSAEREPAQSLDQIRAVLPIARQRQMLAQDRKSTRLNSSHVSISYAVFCLNKKNLRSVRITTARRASSARGV